jgi:hypothetical protein
MPYLCLYEDSIRKPHQIMFKKGGRLKREWTCSKYTVCV